MNFNVNLIKGSYIIVFVTYMLDYLELPIPTNIIKRCALLLLLFTLLYTYRNEIRNKLIPKPKTIYFFIFFNILGIVTSMLTSLTLPSLLTLIGLDIYFIVYFISSYHLSISKNSIIQYNNIVIFSILVMCIFSFTFNLSLTVSQFSTQYYGRTRIYGIFQEPNLLAAVCFVALVANLINFRLTNNKYKKIMYVAISILFLSFLILSDSRGALFNFILFVVMHSLMSIYFKLSNKNKKKFTIISLLTVIAFVAIVAFYIKNQIFSSFNNFNVFTSGRIGNWIYIFDAIYKNPVYFIFGKGLSSGDQGALFHIGRTSDNGYLIWLFQAGIVSLILVFVMIVNMFRNIMKKPFFSIIALPLLISFLVYASIENFLLSFGHIVPFYCWTICFIAFHAKRNYLL
ncbi:O-antigen ligase family protein [Sporolactobacillus nakayamae]|uniref:O-antigen ligase like membrane protein n=1 Tax=Sporolactobacillus nakayamae TaxID=269670 RepID=A0A1I2W4H4_9BACL|nr:oligosaccharide repeat unit polymerase [Sporolactobacillus nakayamae]SFG96294.1 hypothetical protein SAMN02982927_03397 [Sporolactobacillus nakayamae]